MVAASTAGIFCQGEVQESQELTRICALPRRAHTEAFATDIAAQFTHALRKPWGTWNLRPIQGLALYDLAQVGGLVAPIGVGYGKTIISLLAPRVLASERPLIIVPASLKEKTFDDMMELERQFYLPPFVRIESYEFLSRVRGAQFLEQYAPDAIICDEGHRLKNPSAACTKRVRRYLQANHETAEKHGTKKCAFVVMSGTLTKRSLQDYAHLCAWALGDLSPLPRQFPVLMEWCGALDEGTTIRTLHHGALEQLAPGFVTDRQTARQAFRSRLVETPGVIATTEGALDTSLEIDAIVLDEPPAAVEQSMATLRRMWQLPDGHDLVEGVDRWRHAKEIALGFYYKWDPWPPEWWNKPRSEWGSEMRQVLKDNRRHLDTDLQLRNALYDHPEWYPKAAEKLGAWERVKDDFEPNTVPVFLDDYVIRVAEKWAKKKDRKGIVWCEHQAWGERFEDLTGIPCYGESGLDRRGNRIEHHPPGQSMCAMIGSNCTGRNLQAWDDNLLIGPPSGGMRLEQLLGRTHRPGQDSDTVHVDVIFACLEHLNAWEKCLNDAVYVQDTQGAVQKVLYADVTFRRETLERGQQGPMWDASFGKDDD